MYIRLFSILAGLLLAGLAQADIKRTTSGKPDLSGFYDSGTLTPLNRPEEFGEKGVLSPVCSQAVWKCEYMIRLARPELLWAVNSLAREVTKWIVACDKRLHLSG